MYIKIKPKATISKTILKQKKTICIFPLCCNIILYKILMCYYSYYEMRSAPPFLRYKK